MATAKAYFEVYETLAISHKEDFDLRGMTPHPDDLYFTKPAESTPGYLGEIIV